MVFNGQNLVLKFWLVFFCFFKSISERQSLFLSCLVYFYHFVTFMGLIQNAADTHQLQAVSTKSLNFLFFMNIAFQVILFFSLAQWYLLWVTSNWEAAILQNTRHREKLSFPELIGDEILTWEFCFSFLGNILMIGFFVSVCFRRVLWLRAVTSLFLGLLSQISHFLLSISVHLYFSVGLSLNQLELFLES